MLVVAGYFQVDPERRDEFIAGRAEGMTVSRGEPGCLEYTFAADPLEPGRVVLYERWESKAHLADHLAGQRARREAAGDDANAVPVLSSEVLQYEISAVGALGS